MLSIDDVAAPYYTDEGAGWRRIREGTGWKYTTIKLDEIKGAKNSSTGSGNNEKLEFSGGYNRSGQVSAASGGIQMVVEMNGTRN